MPGTLSRRAFTLLEVVIALGILAAAALPLILTFRQSGTRGEQFSAEHFTAMFVAQKVLEDINTRVQENPFFLDQLIASATGEAKPVVDGQSPYFDLLENTINFSYLTREEDQPILPEAEAAYRQLKDFRCQVECRLDVPTNPDTGQPHTNLIEVVVNVTWTDHNGNPNSYSLSQYLRGVSRATFTSLDPALLAAPTEETAGFALWAWLASDTTPTPPPFDSFLTWNGGGGREVVKAIGDLAYFTLQARRIRAGYDTSLAEARQKRDQFMSSGTLADKQTGALWQERVAQLLEQKASTLFTAAARLRPAVARLQGASFTQAAMGSRLYAARQRLKSRCWSASLEVDRLLTTFSDAETEYCALLNAPYQGFFPDRRIPSTIRRTIDLEKIGLIVLDRQGTLGDGLTLLQERLRQYVEAFEGQQPFFVDALRQERQVCQSMASLKTWYGGSEGLTGLIQQVTDLKQTLLTLEDRIP